MQGRFKLTKVTGEEAQASFKTLSPTACIMTLVTANRYTHIREVFRRFLPDNLQSLKQGAASLEFLSQALPKSCSSPSGWRTDKHSPSHQPRSGIHPALILDLTLDALELFLEKRQHHGTPRCLWGIFPPITDNQILVYVIKPDNLRVSFII